MESFADIIAPISEDEFFSDYFRKKPLFIKGSAARADQLMRWADLNRILAMANYWRPGMLDLWYEGRRVPPERYARSTPCAEGEVMLADPESVQAILAEGASLVVNEVDTLVPSFANVANALEEKLGGYSGANIYGSFNDVKAFESHFDVHEVFSFHLEGRKRWNIWEGRLDNPLEPPPEDGRRKAFNDQAKGKLLFEADMEPGDVLYLPRGQYHDAIVDGKNALHVTFSVFRLTGLSIFDLLKAEASIISLFRDDLPFTEVGEGTLRERLDGLKGELGAILDTPEFEKRLALQLQKHRVRRGTFRVPEFETPQHYRVADNGLHVARRGRQDLLVVNNNSVEAPPDAYGLFNWVCAHPQFSAGELRARFWELGVERVDELLAYLLEIGAVTRE